MKDLGLYLHFPFCVRKCSYCDFLSAPADENTKQLYAQAMIHEIRGYEKAAKDAHVSTIFLGGGTPSLMPARSMRRIFQALYETFSIDKDAEITMEMNPGTVNESNLEFVSRYVNRVSLGVQSADNEELKLLGRIHTREDAERSISLLKGAGIRNINIDLMSGIPNETEESWERSLNWAIDQDVSHISAYSLIIEEGTPFYQLRQSGKLKLPDEDAERRMYHTTKSLLQEHGFQRYEISNYAKPGYECCHNVRYWKRKDYLGFGIGAASLMDHKRWHNTENLRHYLEDSVTPERLVRELENLDKRSEIEEFMFLGLRMMRGVSSEEFETIFGIGMEDVYGDELNMLIHNHLLEKTEDGYTLTAKGIDVSNMVLSEFLFD